MRSIWFWQGIISPHMAGLAVALARRGCEVTYVAQQEVTEDRVRQGWSAPSLPGVHLLKAVTGEAMRDLAMTAPEHSIHLCGGLRGNGDIGAAQRALAKRKLAQWVVMETVDDSGWRGLLRRVEYSRLIRERRGDLKGVLAIGERTPAWIRARGMPADAVFPFAYFLPDPGSALDVPSNRTGAFRFLFVGQLIERKRLGMLIDCLGAIRGYDFRLVVAGGGPLNDEFRALADRAEQPAQQQGPDYLCGSHVFLPQGPLCNL